MTLIFCAVLVIVPTAIFTFTTKAHSESRVVREYQIKAAFLYNFAKFVEWPAAKFRDETSPMNLCVTGIDPFGITLDNTVSGKTIKGRSINVNRIDWEDNLKSCHILFVSSSERENLPKIVESLLGAGVLTTGDMDRFARRGGVISLTKKANKIRFEINLQAADRARIKLSSHLLRLATIGTDTTEPSRILIESGREN